MKVLEKLHQIINKLLKRQDYILIVLDESDELNKIFVEIENQHAHSVCIGKRIREHGLTFIKITVEDIIAANKDVLDCVWCKKTFPLMEMYSVDACCAEHQRLLEQQGA